MSIYIGNNLEDGLEILEMENASLKKYSEYHQVVNEIDHISDLHVDSSFYHQSMKIEEGTLILKVVLISVVVSTLIILSQPFLSLLK